LNQIVDAIQITTESEHNFILPITAYSRLVLEPLPLEHATNDSKHAKLSVLLIRARVCAGCSII